MCGIAGLVGGRHHDHELIRRMLTSLAHRGPDDEAIEHDEGAVLAQRRLSIIDLAGGRQPIRNETGKKAIVCNGEIYNYAPLRRELVDKGHRFRSQSDSEVILHLYEEEGTACLARLRGMFAFAIWDGDEGRLFAARDHLGQKPFFYRHDEGTGELAFASEIKGLIPALEHGPKPDLEALSQYLSLRIIASPLTMFGEIRKLPPAHFLTFDLASGDAASGLRIERYWSLSFEPKSRFASDDEMLEALEAELIEAVRLHMVSDVPVGAFLSGGLDSTLVLALTMKHAAKEALPTFTIGIPYGEYDEAPAARAVATAYGTRHHEEQTVPSLQRHLPDLVHHLDEPSDSLSVCSWLISEMARRQVKVVLGGDGGDELFGGYDRYYGNLYAGYYAWLPPAVRRSLIGPVLGLLPDGNWYKSKSHQLKWLHNASFLSGGERYARTLGYFYIQGAARQQLFGPRLFETLEHFDPYAAIARAYDEADAEHPIDRMLYADSRIRLPDHSVMILDRTAMAHGLEARSPLMDHELAGFCARLPTEAKVRFRSLRWIQKRLCERYLPASVLERRKQGFAVALPYLLKDEYRLLFRCFLERSALAREGVLDQAGITALLDEHARGHVDHGNRLWLLLNAEAWYRMHIEGLTRDGMAELIAARAGPAREMGLAA